MVSKKEVSFNGFSQKTLDFLKNLKVNNNHVWFEAVRGEYQEHLLKPLQNLSSDLSEFMLTIDPHFEIRPAVNKTISRIYRDTRFSKDKSPFRDTMWIIFKRPNNDWRDAPAYFFEISPDSYRYGMGFYSAGKETMDRLREMIVRKSKEFFKVVSLYSKQKIFVVEGEKYKKILNNNIPEEFQDWYQKKNLYLVCNRKIDNHLFSSKLLKDLTSGFSLIAPFYHYFLKLK
ncbi:MAG: DUF2461 domain-containing protein [Nitrospinae bacterium]|nr:DUF2461 domain-containing protein [Nitrospinota bacterium]MBI3815861.1 DUF2461 domain-containing protein [Nitrospinota bacterium]